MRSFLGILLGFLLWSALWLLGNSAIAMLFPEAFPKEGEFQVSDRNALLTLLALSVLCSVCAGSAAARRAGRGARAVSILAGILLAVGAAVQAGSWQLLPLWYHAAFLGLLVPMTLLGGRFAPRRD